MDFADETASVFGGWDSMGKPDVLAATGDKSRDISGLLDLGAWTYLQLSCIIRPVSEVVTDILSRRVVNEDTLTL